MLGSRGQQRGPEHTLRQAGPSVTGAGFARAPKISYTWTKRKCSVDLLMDTPAHCLSSVTPRCHMPLRATCPAAGAGPRSGAEAAPAGAPRQCPQELPPRAGREGRGARAGAAPWRPRPPLHLPPGRACGSKMADGEGPGALTHGTQTARLSSWNDPRHHWSSLGHREWPSARLDVGKPGRNGQSSMSGCRASAGQGRSQQWPCARKVEQSDHGQSWHGPNARAGSFSRAGVDHTKGPHAQEGSATEPCFLCPFSAPTSLGKPCTQQLSLQGSTLCLARKSSQ